MMKVLSYFLTVVALCLNAAAGPVHAAAGDSWALVDGWAIRQSIGFCQATKRLPAGILSISLFREDPKSDVNIRVANPQLAWPTSPRETSLRSEKLRYSSATAGAIVPNVYFSDSPSYSMRFSDRTLVDLASSQALTLYFGEVPQTVLSMDGSATAIDLLRQCGSRVDALAVRLGIKGKRIAEWPEAARQQTAAEARARNKLDSEAAMRGSSAASSTARPTAPPAAPSRPVLQSPFPPDWKAREAEDQRRRICAQTRSSCNSTCNSRSIADMIVNKNRDAPRQEYECKQQCEREFASCERSG